MPTGDIVLYCRSGERYARALNLLLDAGFRRPRNLVGGVNAWAATIDPTIPQYWQRRRPA
jgi:adenylyltransferase/sulfurtransferase